MSAMSPFSAANRSLSSRPTRQVSRRRPQSEMDDEEMGESNSSPQEEDNEDASEMSYKKPRRQQQAPTNPLITW